MITTGVDVARIRLGETTAVQNGDPGNGTDGWEDIEGFDNELSVGVSKTKLTPGLPQSLTLTVTARREGKVWWRVKIVGEEHVYWIEVRGRVMGGESFAALSQLSKLEGRRELEEGVR